MNILDEAVKNQLEYLYVLCIWDEVRLFKIIGEYRWKCNRCGGYNVSTSGSSERGCECGWMRSLTFVPEGFGILFIFGEIKI